MGFLWAVVWVIILSVVYVILPPFEGWVPTTNEWYSINAVVSS